MSADLGRVAYDAYRLRRGCVAYDGTEIPEWPALRPEIREAWSDAAVAVVGARSTQTVGAIDLDAARKTAREAQERATERDVGRAGLITREAYDNLLREDMAWLDDMPNTLERRHIRLVLACSGSLYYPIRSDVPDLAALVLAMAEEIDMLQAEAAAERREINGLIEAHHDAVAQVEAAKIEVAALTAQRDEAQARVKRFEAFLPEVGYDPNDV